MNDEELRSTIEEVKAQVKAKPENKDKSDDEIDEIMLNGFYEAFADGDMQKEDLMAIAEAMGYEPTEEFKDQEFPAEGEAPEASKEKLEDLREVKPGESKEEFKEKVEEAKEEGPKADSEEEEEMDEDTERAKASELFGMDLTKKKEEKE